MSVLVPDKPGPTGSLGMLPVCLVRGLLDQEHASLMLWYQIFWEKQACAHPTHPHMAS